MTSQSIQRSDRLERLGWISLISTHWLVLGCLANLWFGWRMLSGLNADYYYLAILFLIGIVFAYSLGFAVHLVFESRRQLPLIWVWFYSLLFLAASWQWTGLAWEDYRIHENAASALVEYRTSVVNNVEENSTEGLATRRDLFDSVNSRLAAFIDQCMFLAILMPFFVSIFVTFKRTWQFSLKELLVGSALLAIVIAVWIHVPFFSWFEWSSCLFVGSTFSGLLGTQWLRDKLGRRIGLYVFFGALLVAMIALVTLLYYELQQTSRNVDLGASLLLGFVVGQLFLTVNCFGPSRSQRAVLDPDIPTPSRQIFSATRRVSHALIAVVLAQVLVAVLTRSIDLTTLLVVADKKLASAQLVAELNSFYSGKSLESEVWSIPVNRAVLLSESNIRAVVATEELVTSDQWQRLNRQFEDCAPSGLWRHNYPVFDVRYMSGRHRVHAIDAARIPSVEWPKYISKYIAVYNGRISNDLIARFPRNTRIDLVNPTFTGPTDYALLRPFLHCVELDRIEFLLDHPSILMELVFDDRAIRVKHQSPDQVAAVLRERVPVLAPWFRFEEFKGDGTYISSQNIEKIVPLNGTAPPNLRLSGLSTNESGHVIGLRCQRGNMKAIPQAIRQDFFSDLIWLRIDGQYYRIQLDNTSDDSESLTSIPLAVELLAFDFVFSWVSLDRFLKLSIDDGRKLSLFLTESPGLPVDFDPELCSGVETLIVPDSPDSRLLLLEQLQSARHIKRLILVSGDSSQQDLAPFLIDGRLDPNLPNVTFIPLSQDQLDLQRSLIRLPFDVFLIEWQGTYEDVIEEIEIRK